MSALDPTPVLPARRDALDRLDVLREQVAAFLDRPTADALHRLTGAVQGFVHFESEHVLTEASLTDLGVERFDELALGHDALASRLNLLAWVVPGSGDAQAAVHQLRHELLVQVERYQALRLPRGTILNGG